MQTATVEEVQANLLELLDRIDEESEVVILQGNKPVGRLLPPAVPKGTPVAGRGKGKLVIRAEDDEHLKDFAEYMP
jgi:antitoxin (DNA-binding transcriptional repressor) of toxin-antitoxin stability system